MSKLLKMFALAAILIMGGQTMAQTHGNMFLCATSPMNNYAKFGNTNDFILTGNHDGANEAAAAIGFNLGFKLYYNVGVEGLDILLSLDGFYNGLNAKAKGYFDERKSVLEQLGNYVEVSVPFYINADGMLGLKYAYYLNPNFGVYLEAGAGVNARFITEYTEKYKDEEGKKHVSTVKYDPGFSFAFQAGLGIEVASNLVIGFSYYNLGETALRAEKTGDELSTIPVPKNTSVKPIMILGRVGFSF